MSQFGTNQPVDRQCIYSPRRSHHQVGYKVIRLCSFRFKEFFVGKYLRRNKQSLNLDVAALMRSII